MELMGWSWDDWLGWCIGWLGWLGCTRKKDEVDSTFVDHFVLREKRTFFFF